MRVRALLGWGIVIYAICTLASTGMEIYGFMQGMWPHIIETFVLFFVCVSAGSALRFRKWSDILPYSIGWAIIFAALSGVFFVPLIGWDLYHSWMLWVDCGLVVLFPLFGIFFIKRKVLRGVWET